MGGKEGTWTMFLTETLKTVGGLTIVLGIVALGLRILNVVPTLLTPQLVHTYASVEEAKRATKVPVYLPSYFPDYLQWPPKEITGRVDPDPMVSLVIVSQTSSKPVLWLDERLLTPSVPDTKTLSMETVTQRKNVELGDGLTGVLEVYRDLAGDRLYYRIQWDLNRLHIAVTSDISEDELVRIAKSMRPLGSY